jgi:ferredoxin-NADP reductase
VSLPAPFEARLVSARKLTPTVRELTFERLDAHPMVFAPGQWVSAFLPIPGPIPGPGPEPSSRLKRSYSIASPPGESARFDIAVTLVQGGPGSKWLHAAESGAELTFIGPQGFFTRAPTDGSPSLMVATGTGLTPMRSMVRAATAAGVSAPMWILLGVRHEEDMLYRDEFEALARQHPNVRFEATLSQGGADWSGKRGYVQTHVPGLWNELSSAGAGSPHAYVCGLERMVGSVRTLLRAEMGLPRQQVHAERYD